MKLIIQIPCYNEEETLPVALADLPRSLPGIDEVEWLVIDDGSTDRTREVAREHGVDHVVGHAPNQGLAKTFMLGLNACLERGADIIVNTDADNQYSGACIKDIVAPILEGRAEFVIGARPINKIEHFSFVKKVLQNLGSSTMRQVSSTAVVDAPSGFRAMTRNVAMRLNVFSEYTYTLETIIQAGHAGIPLCSVPVEVNEALRESRLMSSMTSYIKRSVATMLRMFVVYNPMKFFMVLGTVNLALGLMLCLRWLWFLFSSGVGAHVPSLVAGSILLGVGGLFVMFGILGDLLAVNRKLLEDIRFRVRNLELDSSARYDDGDAKLGEIREVLRMRLMSKAISDDFGKCKPVRSKGEEYGHTELHAS